MAWRTSTVFRISVLVAPPNSAQVEDKTLNRAFAGNLVAGDHLIGAIGPKNENPALRGRSTTPAARRSNSS